MHSFRDQRAHIHPVPAQPGPVELGPGAAVAILAGAAVQPDPPLGAHRLGGGRRGRRRVPTAGAGEGGRTVGRQEGQEEHELRQAQQGTEVRRTFREY